jgi:hypothetical protein
VDGSTSIGQGSAGSDTWGVLQSVLFYRELIRRVGQSLETVQ